MNGTASASSERNVYYLDLDDRFVSGSFAGNEGEEECYKVSLPSDGWLTVACQGLSIRSCEFNLYDKNMDKLLCYGLGISGSSDISPRTKQIRVALAKGTYTIVVDGYGGTGDYKIKTSFKRAGNKEGSHNHTFNSAQKLGKNKQIKGFLSLEESVDFYKIKISKRQKIKIVYAPRIVWSDISIWSYDGTELGSNSWVHSNEDKPESFVREMTLNPGTYYIGIYSRDDVYAKFYDDYYRGAIY